MKLIQSILSQVPVQESQKWMSLKVGDKFEFAMNNLSDEDFEALNDELQGLHIEDKEDHAEADDIISKFLSKHLKESAEIAQKLVRGEMAPKGLMNKLDHWLGRMIITKDKNRFMPADVALKALRSYGFSEDQIGLIRDAAVSACNTAVSVMNKKHGEEAAPKKYISALPSSFGVYDLYLNVGESIREEFAELMRKLFDQKIGKIADKLTLGKKGATNEELIAQHNDLMTLGNRAAAMALVAEAAGVAAQPLRESGHTTVCHTDNLDLVCDGDAFFLKAHGKKIARLSHSDWGHIIDAVKNRVDVNLGKLTLKQVGDAYALFNMAGKEVLAISSPDMGKLVTDSSAYLKNMSAVTEETYTDYNDWKSAVLNSYPTQAAKIKFKGRMEGGKMTVSAEIPGQDRSYGVWDDDKDQGVILSEAAVFKLKAKVKMVGGPVDVKGKEGHIAEIRTDVGGKKTFTIDYTTDSGRVTSVQLKSADLRLVKE